MSNWNHRCCERCWFDSLDGAYPDGTFRMPVQIKDSAPGVCCTCGGMTITGIFVRADPATQRCQGHHDDLSWSEVAVKEPT